MSIRINRVYTRAGDKGFTGLVGGRRVSKACHLVEAYGDIDELNSVLGCVKEHIGEETQALYCLIESIQQELFDLGSELATLPEDRYPGMWRASAEHVTNLERLCDHFSQNLPELQSFILPGGSKLAAELHIARTVCRRAERRIVGRIEEENQRQAEEGISPELLKYVNRLSDLFFVLARWALVEEGRDAPLWIQEKDRQLPESE